MPRKVKDLPDYEERKRLAKFIGLDEPPELDPNAFNELDGLFDDLFPEGEEIDSVELIKQVRLREHYHTSEDKEMNWEERFWKEFGEHYHTWDALQEARVTLGEIDPLTLEEVKK